ncbi:GNAT family N-acetyltransferase [Isoptericola variabilis]|uniref:GCN5-related N-acetyltransferase n=1 Tax=Isoptericola variabilis (strain 225) TaxID=743718 RepID=F6FW90_ISOV2|nr:GNAT family protein [Isoptericola variabilis]AEG45634.1 GCN5-related N-acetyltransferase [Isoptericola variabilis 225]TWH25757.1 aminoglycoside 6'-N-acetyltransferase [Isoptericola variabilis J7]
MTNDPVNDPAPGPDATPVPLTTGRLTLRLYQPDDAGPSLEYYGDPEVVRYLLEDPWTPEDAEARIAKRMARTGIGEPGSALALVVEHEGVVVGDVALWTTGDTVSRGEVGWVVHPAHTGRGYATEAMRALLGLAFGYYGMHRVVAQLDARNERSARLCERLGMRQEGHLRQDWWSKGEWTDTLVYGMLAEEWTTP